MECGFELWVRAGTHITETGTSLHLTVAAIDEIGNALQELIDNHSNLNDLTLYMERSSDWEQDFFTRGRVKATIVKGGYLKIQEEEEWEED